MGSSNSCCATEIVDISNQVEPLDNLQSPDTLDEYDQPMGCITPEIIVIETDWIEEGGYHVEKRFERIYTIEEEDEQSLSVIVSRFDISNDQVQDLDLKSSSFSKEQNSGLWNMHGNTQETAFSTVTSPQISARNDTWNSLNYENGDIYEGYTQQNERHGYGKYYTFEDNSLYAGLWESNLKKGLAWAMHEDGMKQEGVFTNGIMNGYGHVTFPNGDQYTGALQNDIMHGYGVYQWIDGRKYSGYWKQGKLHGHGVNTWIDGRSYVGEYFHSKKQGHGVFTWPNGSKYEGEWFNGQQNGKGTFLGINKQITGVWRDGKIVCKTETSV